MTPALMTPMTARSMNSISAAMIALVMISAPVIAAEAVLSGERIDGRSCADHGHLPLIRSQGGVEIVLMIIVKGVSG